MSIYTYELVKLSKRPVRSARAQRVHNAYSNPAFAVHKVALPTRGARPNQKLSRFGNGLNSANHLTRVSKSGQLLVRACPPGGQSHFLYSSRWITVRGVYCPTRRLS